MNDTRNKLTSLLFLHRQTSLAMNINEQCMILTTELFFSGRLIVRHLTATTLSNSVAVP